jgi:hypothetical protein
LCAALIDLGLGTQAADRGTGGSLQSERLGGVGDALDGARRTAARGDEQRENEKNAETTRVV